MVYCCCIVTAQFDLPALRWFNKRRQQSSIIIVCFPCCMLATFVSEGATNASKPRRVTRPTAGKQIDTFLPGLLIRLRPTDVACMCGTERGVDRPCCFSARKALPTAFRTSRNVSSTYIRDRHNWAFVITSSADSYDPPPTHTHAHTDPFKGACFTERHSVVEYGHR